MRWLFTLLLPPSDVAFLVRIKPLNERAESLTKFRQATVGRSGLVRKHLLEAIKPSGGQRQ